MRVSGFTFLRNAVRNGYPFEESIRSILPIVDEFICVVGRGDDKTRERVVSINDPKIRLIDTAWNESMQDRGYVYGQQKMVGQFNCTGDWAFYLEGDEVLHEEEIDQIRITMLRYKNDPIVEALYFNFLHFYGEMNQIGIAGYRKAPRIIKNSIRTIAPDGLFWVVMPKNKRGRYPRARFAGANIYHYGHCRCISKMASKTREVGKYWGDKSQEFSGYGWIDIAELRPFAGTHPSVMARWLENESEKDFVQNPEYRITFRDLRNRFRFWIEDRFGIEISKKHFKALD